MPLPQFILLPGLDGTGELFAPLLQVIPATFATRVLSYPTDKCMSYDALLAYLDHHIPTTGPLIVLAESFSGPLAIRYAAAHPSRIRALILCASFIASPVPRLLNLIARPLLFHLPPPRLLLRLLLVGRDAPDGLVDAVARAIRRVPADVLAHRVREVCQLDCAPDLANCPMPLLYLAGQRDARVRPSSLRRILAIRPDAVVRTLDAPHLLLQTAPAAAWREIEEFLRNHRDVCN